ncbi:MAG: type II secretion system protein [Patescibacteria group bacterium]
MITKKERGFTIIELLVVVAIIAVLAAIVLVNVTQYINKGKDAAIKGNMATILTNSAVYYDANGNYTNFSASSTYTTPAAAITAAGKTVTPSTNSSGSNFCACSTLFDTTNGNYCVDSSGYKKQTNTACSTRCVTGIGATGVCVD